MIGFAKLVASRCYYAAHLSRYRTLYLYAWGLVEFGGLAVLVYSIAWGNRWTAPTHSDAFASSSFFSPSSSASASASAPPSSLSPFFSSTFFVGFLGVIAWFRPVVASITYVAPLAKKTCFSLLDLIKRVRNVRATLVHFAHRICPRGAAPNRHEQALEGVRSVFGPSAE